MAYLHCENCGWSQDDFYEMNGYNPAKYLSSWNDYLCGKNADKIDQIFSDDAQWLREEGPITNREVIARQYEKFAKRIREMKWVTWEQWERNRDTAVCPKCGKRNFDID